MHRAKRARTDDGESAYAVDSISNGAKPQLTRACAECKKHKIKCFVQPGQSSCTKCLKSGVHCVPHNFARKFMDEDSIWKSRAAETLEQLKDAVSQLLQQNNLPELSSFGGNVPTHQGGQDPVINTSVSPSTTNYLNAAGHGNFTSEGPSADMQQENDSDLVPLPMNNLYNLTEPAKSLLIRVDPTYVNGADFITRGIVTLSEAEFLYNHYMTRINPLLWEGILCSHKTLSEARRSSSLVVATILTVAAMHIPNREETLRAAYDNFVSLMRASCLLRSRNLDDLRGLCIGAFYLTSLSWALCSRAIRVATEMNLHKSSLQFARGARADPAAAEANYERVRLWYVLYVCDHQFALAYGRPPMMHDDAAVRNADRLLASGLSSRGDRQLVAQVKLFRILAGAYFMYGCDPDLELGGQDFEMLQSFNISVDQWRLEHQPKPGGADDPLSTPRGSPFPAKGATLYYHLARFQLNSISLRGFSAGGSNDARDTVGPDMSWERQEAANSAIAAATSTARLLVEDADLREAQIGMPIFVHAMIAVCASFLLKMSVVFSEGRVTGDNGDALLRLPGDLAKYGLNFHTKNALTDVESLVRVLSGVADNASQQHVARQVVTGLKELLQRFSLGEGDTYLYARTSGAMAGLGPFDSGNREVSGGRVHGSRVRGEGLESLPVTAGVDDSQGSMLPEGDPQERTGMASGSLDIQPDPFNLMGDLDWRFNDAFLWGIQTELPYM